LEDVAANGCYLVSCSNVNIECVIILAVFLILTPVSACAFSQVQRQAEETKSGKGPAPPSPAAGGAADGSAPNASSAGAAAGANSAALGEAQTIDALLRLIHFIPKVRTDRILNPKRICRKHQVLEFRIL
jgi:hypothetical protein